MKEADVLKDMLQFMVFLEEFYNKSAVEVRNPEARQLFIQFRDEDMRNIGRLQQKIERVETKPKIITRILPSKTR